MNYRRYLITTVILFAPHFSANSHQEHELQPKLEQIIEYRSSLMNVFLWNFKPMAQMFKKERPFDLERLRRYASNLNRSAQLDLVAGFPEDSDEGETDARADIWLDWDDFSGKLSRFQEKANALDEASQSGDMDRIRDSFESLARSCKACHKAYRE